MLSPADVLASKRAELTELRSQLSCCARCALRFASIRDPALYVLPEEQLNASMADEDGDDYITFDEYRRILLSEPGDAAAVSDTATKAA